MKYIDEFRDGELAQQIGARIAAEADPARTYSFMEFCGGHTHAISRYGVMELLLDCDAGTLAVKKNGKRLGVAATGLTGELCWAVALHHCFASPRIRIVAADAAADGW